MAFGVTEYVKQGPDSCCFLYALINAKRFLGYDTPKPGDKEWEDLVDATGCRYGAVINKLRPAEFLGLQLECAVCSPYSLTPPAILTVANPPGTGMYLHACLYIGHTPRDAEEGTKWILVGYNIDGPLVERVDGLDIEWPPHTCAQHYNVKLMSLYGLNSLSGVEL